MSYLYAGLGIAMLSGIIAMMKIGNNVENFINLIPKDNAISKDYIESNSPSYDKEIIKILYQDSSTVPNSEICEFIVSKINEKKPPTFQATSVPLNKFFSQSCALEDENGKHRVVINQTIDNRYELFSCSEKEKVGNYCKFEMGDKQ